MRACKKLLLGTLVLIFVAYAMLNSISIRTVGASLPTDPCLVIFNNPFPYVDVAIADTFITDGNGAHNQRTYWWNILTQSLTKYSHLPCRTTQLPCQFTQKIGPPKKLYNN